MKKKALSLLLAATMLLQLPAPAFADTPKASATSEEASMNLSQTWKISLPVTATLKSLITQKTKRYNTSASFDARWLIEGDNTVYYPELSNFAMIMAFDADSESVTLKATNEAGESIDTKAGFGSLQTFFGMEDVKVYRLNAEEYPYDTDPEDRTVAIVGHYPVSYNGEAFDLLSVTIQATQTNQSNEWLSNMDVGAETDAYEEMSGEHPYWTDHKMHKGFAVAANRVYEVLQAYEAAYLDSNANKSALITGHSRGAAIANILGAYYEDDPEFRSYTYTFATPETTTDEYAPSYQTIFNILNSDDLVTHVPLTDWGFKRFGTDLSIKGSKYRTSYRKLVGSIYDAAYSKTLKKKMLRIAKTRDSLYEISDKTYHKFGTYTSKKKAQKKYDQIEQRLEKEGLLPYVSLKLTSKKVNGIKKYTVSYKYCPGYALLVVCNLLTTEEDLDKYLANHPLNADFYDLALAVIETIPNNAFMDCHTMTIYWLITQKNDFGYQADDFI